MSKFFDISYVHMNLVTQNMLSLVLDLNLKIYIYDIVFVSLWLHGSPSYGSCEGGLWMAASERRA